MDKSVRRYVVVEWDTKQHKYRVVAETYFFPRNIKPNQQVMLRSEYERIYK